MCELCIHTQIKERMRMDVNTHFNMKWELVLFCLFTFQSVSLSTIVQYPAVVKVFRGETVSLTCNTVEVLSMCDLISWLKVEPRSREMIVASVHTDLKVKPCTGFIYNASMADSGIYYCSVKHSVISYRGNGSTVIITERHPRPIVTLYVPDVSVGPSVSLQCVVMGVVPSDASVSWVIGESEMTGWTESGWTHTNDSAVEYTRAHVSIPSETWMQAQSVECVVQVDGRRVSKTLKRGSSQVCSWLLYLGSGAIFAFITVIITTVSRRESEDTDSREITEVQYTSVDLVCVGEHGKTALNQNC